MGDPFGDYQLAATSQGTSAIEMLDGGAAQSSTSDNGDEAAPAGEDAGASGPSAADPPGPASSIAAVDAGSANSGTKPAICAVGYVADGDRCAPVLSKLVLSVGTLVPALHPQVTKYTLEVPVPTREFSLTPSVLAGAKIQVNGVPVDSGATWTSSAHDTAVTIALSDPDKLGRGYELQVVRGTQEAYLKEANHLDRDRFGYAVALDSDTLAVSGPLHGPTETERVGSVSVFERRLGRWELQSELQVSHAGWLGWSMALHDDILVVGDPLESSGARGVGAAPPEPLDESMTASGAVYVFIREGAVWKLQAYLKANNPQAGDQFGTSVGFDGGDLLVVGAPDRNGLSPDPNAPAAGAADENTRFSGAAYVFRREGATWSQRGYLKGSDAAAYDHFGASVAISNATVVIGATGDVGVRGAALHRSGSAHVFECGDGSSASCNDSWVEATRLKAPTTGVADGYGSAVAIEFDKLLVASPGERGTTVSGTDLGSTGVGEQAQGSGAVYAYMRTDKVWSQTARLTSLAEKDGSFGYAVAFNRDVAVVGSGGEAASVFVLEDGAFHAQTLLKANNGELADGFGMSVSTSKGVVAVGARFESSAASGVNGRDPGPDDNNAFQSGAAYVFR